MRIRCAGPGDIADVMVMVHELAMYERSAHLVEMTEAQLRALVLGTGDNARSLDDQPALYCHVAEADDGALVGFAIWFLNMSTWSGTHGIYLEDLYVRPAHRGQGTGLALMAALASICVEHGYARLEWWVLDWNQPAIDFYRSIGAIGMEEWTVQRLTGPPLVALAARATPTPR